MKIVNHLRSQAVATWRSSRPNVMKDRRQKGEVRRMAPESHIGRQHLRSLALVVAMLALTFAPGASGNAAANKPAPRLADPTRTGTRLVNEFFTLLAHKDRAALQRFLSPAFQVQRADGSSAQKREYLANLATINNFELTKVRGTQAGATLVVRYLATVEGVVNGKPYKPGPAPRLSVFAWSGKRWQLAAHANFNPLTG
jgi:hypothetical protein